MHTHRINPYLGSNFNVMHSVYATVNIRLKGYLQIFKMPY